MIITSVVPGYNIFDIEFPFGYIIDVPESVFCTKLNNDGPIIPVGPVGPGLPIIPVPPFNTLALLIGTLNLLGLPLLPFNCIKLRNAV